MKIFKYDLPEPGISEVEMPANARILAVRLQGERPRAWALVDDSAPKRKRRLEIVGTGWDIDAKEGVYIATWQDGPFVWHLFDRGETDAPPQE